MSEHFLVTGAMGCLGSWAVKELVEAGTAVTVFDVHDNNYRMKWIMEPGDLARVEFIRGDITDFEAVRTTVSERRITHVLHLAALQVPFCRADPVLGMRVNAVGTTTVFEAVRQCRDQIEGLVYCSSAAAYGDVGRDPAAPAGEDTPLDPNTIYGVTKQANEGTARIYWQDHGLASIGFRPHTVYGVGRDQGMTSTPTKAMLAAAAGLPYRIVLSGAWTYHHAGDAASCLIRAARSGVDGAEVLNMGGNVIDMNDVVATIEEIVPEARGTITVADQPLALPAALDDSRLKELIPGVTWRPFSQGVQKTIDAFRELIAANAIDPQRGLD